MSNNLSTGRMGENMAAHYLELHGFIIIARNWRYSHAEMDIIAYKGNTLHFIEVKTKYGQEMGAPELKVNAAKVKQMKKAAEAYLNQHAAWQFIQFDIVAITLSKQAPPDILFIEDIN